MVSNSLLRAGIQALAALGARHQRFPLADALFIQGKSGTIINTPLAIFTLFSVNAHIKDIYFIR